MDITNHRVLVTGGSAGIGLAIAREFLARGNQVAICGRRDDALQHAAHANPGLVPIRCDVGNRADLKNLLVAVSEQMGGLSVLVNNAGVQYNYDFHGEPWISLIERIDAEIAINLLGVARTTALFLPLLQREPRAAIVNVSSGLAIVPKKSAPIYCATKAAVHSFSKSLRWQMEDSGSQVKVFEVLPPLVDTAMTAGRGTGKLSPQQVATAVMRGLEADRPEISIGKTRVLRAVNRILPPLADRIMRNA